MTKTYEIDPLQDVRWPQLLACHSHSTVFHTRAWLSALQETYGYHPSALTISAPSEELTNAVVFCRVESWLTGSRVVSLPFADHCTPLVSKAGELQCLLAAMQRECEGKRQRYIEIRSVSDKPERAPGFSESGRYYLHRLDLRPSLDELFRRLHPSCIRRRLTRARQEQFVYEEGRSDELLRKFYQLAVLTRRRQNLPPQPLAWFRNLIRFLGEQLKIRVVSYSGEPAAAILTTRFQGTMTYKYGVSDRRFHRCGSMQLLLWKAIEDAKDTGLTEFDMGRTDWTNEGLATFKDRWGCSRFQITHLRYPAIQTQLEKPGLKVKMAKQLFALAPDTLLMTAGKLLYRHMA